MTYPEETALSDDKLHRGSAVRYKVRHSSLVIVRSDQPELVCTGSSLASESSIRMRAARETGPCRSAIVVTCFDGRWRSWRAGRACTSERRSLLPACPCTSSKKLQKLRFMAYAPIRIRANSMARSVPGRSRTYRVTHPTTLRRSQTGTELQSICGSRPNPPSISSATVAAAAKAAASTKSSSSTRHYLIIESPAWSVSLTTIEIALATR